MLGAALVTGPSRSADPREVLDRVVASIGDVALTQRDVVNEYRFELFFQGRLPAADPDPTTFNLLRDRLIDQKLLLREADAEGIKQENFSTKAAETLDEVRKAYGSEEAYQSALRDLGMDEQQVVKRLAEQEIMMRIIDQRLRPAAWVERSEIETYYQKTFLPEYIRRSREPAPALEEVEKEIREILVQQKIDRLLQAWLQELKAEQRVTVHSF